MAVIDPRIATGIPGVDPILDGGLPRGSISVLIGAPGAGKTIFANQLCYHQARLGHRAVYFTLLSESHTGMLQHIRRMAFFSEALVGDAVVYFSGYKVLQGGGLAALARLIGQVLADRQPTVVVLDGFVAVGEAAEHSNELREVVRQIQAFSASVGCATVLIGGAGSDLLTRPEHALADAVIELSHDLSGLRELRHLQVHKLRGGRPINGRHSVVISDAGMTVRPRFEVSATSTGAALAPTPRARFGHGRAGFGIAELDAMMHGGPLRASTTMLLGASGVGKTTLALHFLAAGAAAGEAGLYFSMYEQPDDLLDKGDRLGIPVRAGVEAGTLHLQWERPIEGVLDVLADRLLAQVRATAATRLCIDGLHTLFRTVDFPERMRAVSAALGEALTALGVTTVYTLESPELVGEREATLRVPISDLSAMCHNIVTIRQVERDDRYDRVLAVLKMRDSDYERDIRELTISSRGITIARRARHSTGRRRRAR